MAVRVLTLRGPNEVLASCGNCGWLPLAYLALCWASCGILALWPCFRKLIAIGVLYVLGAWWTCTLCNFKRLCTSPKLCSRTLCFHVQWNDCKGRITVSLPGVSTWNCSRWDWQKSGVPWIFRDNTKQLVISLHFCQVRTCGRWLMLTLWPCRWIRPQTQRAVWVRGHFWLTFSLHLGAAQKTGGRWDWREVYMTGMTGMIGMTGMTGMTSRVQFVWFFAICPTIVQ